MPTSYRDDKPIVTLAEPVQRLRREGTDAERALWRRLRARQLAGAKFRRQHQFGPFVLDLYCPEHHLAIELDGDQHADLEHRTCDRARTEYLQNRDVRVLRFSNRDALTRTESVLETIWLALTGSNESPLCRSPREG